MSILVNKSWPWLKPMIRIELYGRDGANGRIRIEVDAQTASDRHQALNVTMACVKCGRTIHPVRARNGKGHLFFAATCELEHTTSCARSKAASLEYNAICRAVRPDLGR